MNDEVLSALARVARNEVRAADTVLRKRELPDRLLAERWRDYREVSAAWLRGRAHDRAGRARDRTDRGAASLKNPQLTGSSDTSEADGGRDAMADRENVRQQFVEAFEGADYPVNSPMDLVPALPNGPATEFEIGDETITAMELNQEASGRGDYPYDSVDDLVDDLVEGMADEGYFD